MNPATLRALAIQAAGRGEWIKAADLQGQAADLETAAAFGRDPYNFTPTPARAADPWAAAFPGHITPEQHAQADRLLAGAPALTLED